MKNVKLKNIQNVYLNDSKVTLFDVYYFSEKDNAWIFDYNDYIHGWFKRESTILSKHIAFNNKY